MKARYLIGAIGAAAGAYWLVKNWGRTASAPPEVREPENAAVVHLVEETLQKHSGEENAIVHAFEAALEQETRYDEELAHDNGLVHA